MEEIFTQTATNIQNNGNGGIPAANELSKEPLSEKNQRLIKFLMN